MGREQATGRKIHLDFHTPHWVKQVGQEFNPEELVQIWKEAKVNAVTVVFGMCACGNAYYRSDVAPVHPGLQQDLLSSLLPVANREGIQVHVHFGLGINDRAVMEHPDWAMQLQDGRRLDTDQGKEWGWVCYNSPYVTEHFWPQLEEFVPKFPDVAGIFIDMVMYPEQTCYCSCCQAKADRLNLDLRDADDMNTLIELTLDEFMGSTRAIVKRLNPEMEFTCNTRCFVGGARSEHLDFLELEAPVTFGSFYFPVMARYVRTLNKPHRGMTTRFPKNWGYFGSLNTDIQLTFECAEILATLGPCCIGDHLPADGKPEPGVYELIGKVYQFVEEREQWALEANTVPYIAILGDNQRNVSSRFVSSDYYSPHQTPAAFFGAGVALLEESLHFDVLDQRADFNPYQLLWLPENKTFDPARASDIREFVEHGGRLLVTGHSIWENDQWREVLEKLTAVKYVGKGELRGEFVQPLAEYCHDVPNIAYFIKSHFAHWTSGTASTTIAKTFLPYEGISPDRRFGHFHAPVGEEASHPGAVLNTYGKGQVIAVAGAIAEDYFHTGSRHIRKWTRSLINLLLPPQQQLINVESGSSSVEVSLQSQPGRWILHLIQYSAKRYTENTVIDEVPVRFGIPVHLRPTVKPQRVYLAPSQQELTWTWRDGTLYTVVPALHIHQMVVIDL